VTLQRTAIRGRPRLRRTPAGRIDSHFARYVDTGLLAGWQIAIVRAGEVVHTSTYGQRDVEADRAVQDDTLWRITR
jgi:CubicO group peptidase (beta-lactamase class C family)